MEYKQQLIAVVEALRESPQNEELNILKRDLSEVIALTEESIRYKESNEQLLETKDIKPEDIGTIELGTNVFIGLLLP